jgi:hypothetical protein
MVLPSTTTPSLSDTTPQAVTSVVTLDKFKKFVSISESWIAEQNVMARRVARYRRYYDGDHDMPLTTEMKELLRIQDSDDGLAINLMPTVVDTMADRCIVKSIEGVDPTPESAVTDQSATPEAAANGPSKSSRWAQEIQELTRFDVIQGDVHQGAIRDGNTYLMVGWDNDKKQVCFYVEPAFDGVSGMLMIYRSRNSATPYAAVKVWQVEGETAPDSTVVETKTRCNVYYPDRIEKYIANGSEDFGPYLEDDRDTHIYPWTMGEGSSEAIGLPVVPFRNGGRENYGISEMRNAIPPQNALNRFNYSAVMTAELTAFPIYLEVGFDRGTTKVTPGMVVRVPVVSKDSHFEYKKIEGSSVEPILAMIDSQRKMIAEITRTPTLDLMGSDDSSGESLKQREIGLLGKVRRFTTRAGGSWEQVFDLAWRVQQAFGTVKPPAYKRFVCTWESPEIRNDVDTVKNAVAAEKVMGERQTLRNLAAVFNLTEEQIEAIIKEKQQTPAAAPASGPESRPFDQGEIDATFRFYQGMKQEMNVA